LGESQCSNLSIRQFLFPHFYEVNFSNNQFVCTFTSVFIN
jgi:hypothetical protein